MSDTMTTAQAIEEAIDEMESRCVMTPHRRSQIAALYHALSRLRQEATPNDYHALQQWADRLPVASRDLFWQDIQRVIGRREGDGTTLRPKFLSTPPDAMELFDVALRGADNAMPVLIAMLKKVGLKEGLVVADEIWGNVKCALKVLHEQTAASPTPEDGLDALDALWREPREISPPSALPATVQALDPYYARKLQEIRERPRQGTGGDVPILLAIVDALLSALAQKEPK